MKWALMSDIHANLQALHACMNHARQQGIDQWAVLGDTVGYGADPVPVLDIVIGLHEQGAVVLQGNHDAMGVCPPPNDHSMGASTAIWTHQQLPPDYRQFLAGLPLTHQTGHWLLAHASAHQPDHWHYVDSDHRARQCLNAATQDTTCSHVFLGHVHQQQLYYQGTGRQLMHFSPVAGVDLPMWRHRCWVATVGSVGQPRDGHTRAMYATYDDQRCLLTFHRVDYDHTAAAARIRRAGLPEYLAHRLGEGR